jgi:hypothetical protein
MERFVMKRFLLVTIALMLSVCLFSVSAAESKDDEKAISKVLESFPKLVANRDRDGMKNILHPGMIVVGAGSGDAEVVPLANLTADQLLPPEGNDEWKNTTFTEVNVQISKTMPSIAIASFVLRMKRSDQEPVMDKAMFAMLAKNHGEWRIVSMTMPK